jgi:hypothetical protein
MVSKFNETMLTINVSDVTKFYPPYIEVNVSCNVSTDAVLILYIIDLSDILAYIRTPPPPIAQNILSPLKIFTIDLGNIYDYALDPVSYLHEIFSKTEVKQFEFVGIDFYSNFASFIPLINSSTNFQFAIEISKGRISSQ